MEELLGKIKHFADNAHGSQMRKYTPERYIVHPIRVMETCRRYDTHITVLAAALLHDVLEDTEVDRITMLDFLLTLMSKDEASKTLVLVEELTDVYTKKTYPQWNRKKRKQMEHERLTHICPEAQTIKYADILDNSKEITEKAPDFAPRYLQECLDVLEKTDKGNADLRNRALDIVHYGLGQTMDKSANRWS
jgi:(p)ppGpp synthase/HD superfamily hydrolase